jgi:hypothetical protein
VAASDRLSLRAALRGAGGARPMIPIVNGYAEELLGRAVTPTDVAAVVQATLRLHALFGGDAALAAWSLSWDGAQALAGAVAGVHAARPALPVGVAVAGLSTAVSLSSPTVIDQAIDALTPLGEAQPDFVIVAEEVAPDPALAGDYDELWSVLAHFEVPSVLLPHPRLGREIPPPGRTRLPDAVACAEPAGWMTGLTTGCTLRAGVDEPAPEWAAFSMTDWCWGPPLPLADARNEINRRAAA